MAATGCFFGGENDLPTSPSKENPYVNLSDSKSIVPGFYATDFSTIDSNWAGLQSEFILNSDGTYRSILVFDNDARYDQQGKWIQEGSELHFFDAKEASGDYGVFFHYADLEDDTNSIRNVTDTSFIRREYTPLRQKPYWVTYIRKTYPRLKDGDYTLVKRMSARAEQNPDSTVDVRFRINLHGLDYFLTVFDDTLESLQNSAQWSQIGSFLATENNLHREIMDSTKTLNGWDTLGGVFLTRLNTVSDTSFHMWASPDLSEDGGWEPYRRAL